MPEPQLKKLSSGSQIGAGETYTSKELLDYCRVSIPNCAPHSPGRIRFSALPDADAAMGAGA